MDRSRRFFAGLNSQVLEDQLESVKEFFGFDMPSRGSRKDIRKERVNEKYRMIARDHIGGY